ncbi:MAG: biotin--[Clostridia bacterium]|nr:biotin--[acetyl-CoA-carboxylase] ligase [Clostridia bacterium]
MTPITWPTEDLLRASLPSGVWVERHEAIDSTNLRAKALAREGAPHLSLVWADTQTAGRGRFDRRFYSPGGVGFYCSLVVRPTCSPEQLSLLTPCAAVAVAEAIEKTHDVSVGIKWVNDLYLSDKKVAGILTEAALRPDGAPDYAVIGIGLNVRSSPLPEELAATATSLEAELGGAPLDPARLAEAIFARLAARLSSFETGEFLPLYRERSILDGKTVTVTQGERTLCARVLGIGDRAELLLDAEGERISLSSGEVVSLHGTSIL